MTRLWVLVLLSIVLAAAAPARNITFRNVALDGMGATEVALDKDSQTAIFHFPGKSAVGRAKLSEFELTFPDSVHQFNAGDGN